VTLVLLIQITLILLLFLLNENMYKFFSFMSRCYLKLLDPGSTACRDDK